MATRRIVFNFHRVSGEKKVLHSPFDRLSRISCEHFRVFICILKLQASFEQLDKLLIKKNLHHPLRSFVHFTFDDVSSSFVQDVLPIIEKSNIPVTLFVSVANANKGFNWRDKVYYILTKPDLRDLFVLKTKQAFGDSSIIRDNDIYQWTKKPEFNQIQLENVIDDVLEMYQDDFIHEIKKHKPYLDWDDLKHLTSHPLITIGNHGLNHYNYNSLSDKEMKSDIEKSHEIITKELKVKCKHFAVPFGNPTQRILPIVSHILEDLNYISVGWVKRTCNVDQRSEGLRHYARIDSGQNVVINMVKYWKAFFNVNKNIIN